MTSLIERIESAEGPSRELDAEIAFLVRVKCIVVTRQERADPFGKSDAWVEVKDTTAPRYTASIDAALMLVPKGRVWEVRYDPRLSRALIMDQDGFNQHHIVAATPALALCAAALRARGEPV